MKLITVTLALLLLVIPGYEQSNNPQAGQTPKAELLKLEAKLQEIDKEPDPFKVKVTGHKESSGKIKISVDREAASVYQTGDSAIRESSTQVARRKSGKTKETLLDLDLSRINVPDEYIDEKISAVFGTQTNCGTIPGVVVVQDGVSPDYLVVDDYVYDSGAYRITVPKGFRYDRASIPRIFWAIIDKDSLGNVAPLLHDLLYRNGGSLPRNQVSP
jgi:hypothetical protein